MVATNGFDKDPERAAMAGRRSKRGKSRKKSLEELLELAAPISAIEKVEKLYGELPGKTNADLLSAILVQQALGGNIQAHKEINDRVDGRAHQAIELSGDQEKPALIIERYKER